MFTKKFRKLTIAALLVLSTFLSGGAGHLWAFSVDVKKLYYADYMDQTTTRRVINYDFSGGSAAGNVITIPTNIGGANGVVKVPPAENPPLTYTFGPSPDPNNDISVALNTGAAKATLASATNGGLIINTTAAPGTPGVPQWGYAVALTNFAGMTDSTKAYVADIGFGSMTPGPHPEFAAVWAPAAGGGWNLILRAEIYDDTGNGTTVWGPYTSSPITFNPASDTIVLRVRCLDPNAVDSGNATMVFDYSLDGGTNWASVATLVFPFLQASLPASLPQNFPHYSFPAKFPYVELRVESQNDMQDPFNTFSSHEQGMGYYALVFVGDQGQQTYSSVTAESFGLNSGETGYLVTTPMEYSNNQWWLQNPGVSLGTALPTVYPTYRITATRKDLGPNDVQDRQITGYVEDFVAITSPSASASLSTAPTFSWTWPSTSPAVDAFTVIVWEGTPGSGTQVMNQPNLPASTTSVPYSGNSLLSGHTYNYTIIAEVQTSGVRNQSHAGGTFTYTGPNSISFSGGVKTFPSWPAIDGAAAVAGTTVAAYAPGSQTPISTVMPDNGTGAFTLTGIPPSSDFYLMVQPPAPPPTAYMPVLSKFMNWNDNIQALLPFALFTQTQYASFSNGQGNGMIIGRVVLKDNPTTFLSGAAIEAREWTAGNPPVLGTTYPVTYTSGSSTGADGVYMVKSVPAGKMVQLVATLNGHTFEFNGAVVPIMSGGVSEESFFATSISSCTYLLNPISAGIPAAGTVSAGSVTVTAGGGCAWTAVSNDAGWLHVTAPGTGTGNGSFTYTVDANSGTARIGTISIAGQNFTVLQGGTVINSPIVGVWGASALQYDNAHPDVWYTESSRIVFNSDGTGSITGTKNDGVNQAGQRIQPINESFTYNLTQNTDGSTNLALDFGGGVILNRRFVPADDGSMAVMDGVLDPNWEKFTILIRMDANKTYGNADVTGEYYSLGFERNVDGVSLQTDPPNGNGRYMAISSVHNFAGAAGTYTYTGKANSVYYDGHNGIWDDNNAGTRNYAVSSGGTMTGGGGAFQAYISGDGKVFAGTGSYSSNNWMGYFFMKKGDRNYVQGDMAGKWAVVSFGQDSQTGQPQSLDSQIGTMDCNNTGACSFTLRDRRSGDGSTHVSSGSGQFTVATDGSFGGSLGGQSPSYAGAIGNNGNTIVFNTSFDPTETWHREIFVGIRASGIGDLAGADTSTDVAAIQAGYASAVAALNAGHLNDFMAFVWSDYLNNGETKTDFQNKVQQDIINQGAQLSYVLGTITFQGDLAYVPVTWTVSIGGQQQVDQKTMILKKVGGVWGIYGNQARHGVFANSQYWPGATPGYFANFNVEDKAGITSVSVISGPGVSSTLFLQDHPGNGGWWYEDPAPYIGGPTPPSGTQSYLIRVCEGATCYDYTREITGYVTEFATNLSPIGTAGGPIVFTWNGIAGATRYGIELKKNDSSPSGQSIWSNYDIAPSPTGIGRVVYPGPALEPAQNYFYFISSFIDSGNGGSGNSSFAQGQFTYGGTTGISLTGILQKNSDDTPLSNAVIAMAENTAISTTTRSDGTGGFTLSGLPSGSEFSIKFSKPASDPTNYVDTYTNIQKSTGNMSPVRPYKLFTSDELSTWKSWPNYGTGIGGVIRGRVSTSSAINNQFVGYISNAVVTYMSALGRTDYAIMYEDGSKNLVSRTGGTYANGRFYILNVAEGDVVTVYASQANYTFPQAGVRFIAHDGAVTTGGIGGTPVSGRAEFGGYIKKSDDTPMKSAIIEQVGASAPANATISNEDGTYYMTVPSGTSFYVKITKPQATDTTYAPTYSAMMNFTTTGSGNFNLYPASKLTDPTASGGWELNADKGIIRGRVNDYSNNYLEEATVTTASTKGNNYAIKYCMDDGTTCRTTMTYSNGRFQVMNVVDDDTVTVTAVKTGFAFPTKTFHTHASSVHQGGPNATSYINVLSADIPVGGTNTANSVAVSTNTGFSWTAVSNVPWIHITAGASGSGSRTVSYTVEANALDARTGTMTIAGQTFTVNQTGAIQSVLKGDINGDGSVNLADAILALKVIAGMQPAGIRSNYATSGADVNENGKIGLIDLSYILQLVAGLRTATTDQQAAVNEVNASLAYYKSIWNANGTNYDYTPFFHPNYLNDGLNRALAVQQDMPPSGFQIDSYTVNSVISYDPVQRIITVAIYHSGTVNSVPESGLNTETLIYDNISGYWLRYGNQRIGEFSVWTGTSRTMQSAGITDQIIAHFHLKALKDTVTQVVVNGPESWSQTFINRQPWSDDPTNFDGFYTSTGSMEIDLNRTPVVGDTYTFTVSKAVGGTVTYTQTIAEVMLDAATITSPNNYALANANIGSTLNVTWTLPGTTEITMDSLRLQGQVCNVSGCQQAPVGTITGLTGGTITLPFLSDASSAYIDLRIHKSPEVFTNCHFEFQ